VTIAWMNLIRSRGMTAKDAALVAIWWMSRLRNYRFARLYGGDDLTFVCDGRLNAKTGSRERNTCSEVGKRSRNSIRRFHSGAALHAESLMVKTHYPFSAFINHNINRLQ